MEFIFFGATEETSECPFNSQDIERCPFLRNINTPTNFSFTSVGFSNPVRGAKGPIFEDGPNFNMAFKLFHGKDGVVPLSGKTSFHEEALKSVSASQLNLLAAKAATISLSGFGSGGHFGFDFFKNLNNQRKKIESSKSQEGGDSAKHMEMEGKEWLESGNCPIAKSYRAVNGVLPIITSAFRPPPGLKLKCPQAIVAARAALARTAFCKNLRPQTLPTKMLVIGALGMAVNIPLGIWREHTKKFSVSWFVAVHAAVPFIGMLRKTVLMPKNAMALTIAASILGQVIGSRAERIRMKAKGKREKLGLVVTGPVDGFPAGNCGKDGMIWDPVSSGQETALVPASSPVSTVCF